MEEQTKTLGEYLAVLRRRKWQVIVPAVIIFAVVALVAVALPPTYRSTGIILIEQQDIPVDLVRSTVTTYADQRVQVISQRVMTTANLGKIIESYNLYPDLRQQMGLALVVDRMRDDISLDMISADVVDPRSGRATTASIAFSLSYDNESPQLAQKVANEIVSLFLNENLKERRKAAKETTRFLEEEAKKLAEQISTLESQLASFKEKHPENLPELVTLNLQLMERAETLLRDNDQSMRAAVERKIYLESELAKLNPYSQLYSATGERVLSAADRLKALEAEYVGVASRYSKAHPDRIKMEREIAALRKQVQTSTAADLERSLTDLRAQLAALKSKYSDAHPDVKKLRRSIDTAEAQLAEERDRTKANGPYVEDADNPAYVELQARLESADAELASLKKRHEELQDKLTEYENRITQSPQIEREYRALSRDYDNATLKYREIKAKQMEAELAEALETESKGERFSLIEPPLEPEEPVSPNRLAIVFLGFVLSVGGGIGNLAIRETLDSSVRGEQGVLAIVGVAPLATIPYIETEADLQKRAKKKTLVIVGLCAFILVMLVVVHLVVMPLDVLWYLFLRRMGLAGVG